MKMCELKITDNTAYIMVSSSYGKQTSFTSKVEDSFLIVAMLSVFCCSYCVDIIVIAVV